VIFITLALSLVALYFSVEMFPRNNVVAWYFLLFGFIGLGLSLYMLIQMSNESSSGVFNFHQ